MVMGHFDWKDHTSRLKYEEKMKNYKEWRWNWSWKDKFMWIIGLVVVEGFFVILLYGGSAYMIREQALAEKLEIEEQMESEWIAQNGNITNGTMPSFEYYDLENHFFIHYFQYCTVACQGQAFFYAILFQFLDYKWFAFMITVMYGICLPVDTLIFYKETDINCDHL